MIPTHRISELKELAAKATPVIFFGRKGKEPLPVYDIIDPQTLLSLLEEVEARQWRPIETIPIGEQVMLGKWHEDHGWYWIASGSIEVDGGHWCDLTDDDFEPFSHQDPTHWQPLPSAPEQAP